MDINVAHDFKNIYTHQWGLFGGKAYSDWKCKKCGATFTHFYRDNPDIFDAIKDAGIDVNRCESENK